MCETVFKYILIVVSVSTLSGDTLDRVKRQETGNEGGISNSTISSGTSSTQNITIDQPESPGAGTIGLVIGVLVGVVFAVAVAVLILMVYIKRKRDRDSEYARAAKVQRNSMMNAGVYNDLTTASPIVKKPLDRHQDSSEMASLNRADDEEI